MTRQVMKLIHRGIYTVVYDDSRKGNRYGIYRAANGRKVCVERYEDLTSCLYRLLELVNNGRIF